MKANNTRTLATATATLETRRREAAELGDQLAAATAAHEHARAKFHKTKADADFTQVELAARAMRKVVELEGAARADVEVAELALEDAKRGAKHAERDAIEARLALPVLYAALGPSLCRIDGRVAEIAEDVDDIRNVLATWKADHARGVALSGELGVPFTVKEISERDVAKISRVAIAASRARAGRDGALRVSLKPGPRPPVTLVDYIATIGGVDELDAEATAFVAGVGGQANGSEPKKLEEAAAPAAE